MTLQADEVVARSSFSSAAGEQLLTALAHELRTPLTAIRGFAALLQSLDANDEGARREITERLVRNAVQMELLLDSMLDAARDSRLESLAPRLISLHAAVLGAVEAMGPALEDHRVEVRGGTTFAFVDPHVLTRILTCLLTNAVRYSPSGASVEVEAARGEDGFVRLTISDAGPGVGLDLAIAQELCARSGGTLALASTRDGDARFEVVLPSVSR